MRSIVQFYKNEFFQVLLLMNPRYSFLALNALKFFRKIVGLKDEFYNRYIIKFDLMSFVIDAFVKNGLKHNMLNSAVLELLEFIKSEDIKTLIKYVCEKHITKLMTVEQCSTFKALRTKFEQQLERESSKKGETIAGPKNFDTSNRFRRDARDLDENEENYFNDEDPSDLNKPLYNSPLVVQNKVLDTKPPPNKVINSEKVMTTPLEKVITPSDKVIPTINSTTLDKVITTPLDKVMSSSLPALDKVISASSPLVDYADDSDEEDEPPLNKRQKMSSTVT